MTSLRVTRMHFGSPNACLDHFVNHILILKCKFLSAFYPTGCGFNTLTAMSSIPGTRLHKSYQLIMIVGLDACSCGWKGVEVEKRSAHHIIWAPSSKVGRPYGPRSLLPKVPNA
ncbi:hypothetical protein QQP08_027600 [Theobroma cacao]|nr:hypothetical protein QQP08_027600 [Theobroma cacao]